MPTTAGAKRAHRLSIRRTARNAARWRRLEQAITLARRQPSAEHRRAAQQLIDKAKKWRIVSRARASRLTSRLYRASIIK